MTKERLEFERALTNAAGLTPLEEVLLAVQVMRKVYGGEWVIWADAHGRWFSPVQR